MRIDNKITKERVDHHLEYDWFKYVAILLAVILLWWFVYDTIDKLKSHQMIEIFGINLNLHDQLMETLNNDFVQYLESELNDDTVKQVSIGSDSADYDALVNGTDTTFFQLLQTRFATNDLVIAEEMVFGYLAYTGKLVQFDEADPAQELSYYNYQGVFGVTDKLAYNTDTAYYVMSDERFGRFSTDFKLYDTTDSSFNEENVKGKESTKGKIFGVELNSLAGEGANGLIFPFGDVLNEEGKAIAKKKYYIGVVRESLMGSSSGANKGAYNVGKESKENAQAFDFISYLIKNAKKYKI